MKLPPEKFVSSSQSPEDAPTEKKKIILNSSDELYGELRDKNFNAVGSLVSKKAKTITAEFDVILKILFCEIRLITYFAAVKLIFVQ